MLREDIAHFTSAGKILEDLVDRSARERPLLKAVPVFIDPRDGSTTPLDIPIIEDHDSTVRPQMPVKACEEGAQALPGNM